jgi:hypothetical protein
VDTVTVAARASVNADVLPLRRGEAVQNLVVDVNEGLEHLPAGPRIARVVLASKPTWNAISQE